MPLNLPNIGSLGNKAKPVIQAFSQLNRNEIIADYEIADGRNLSSDHFPVLTGREPRNLINTIVNPSAYFEANGKICYISGTDFYYDGVVKGTVTAGKKSIVDFNGKILIFPDKKYYDYVAGTFGNIGSGVYPAAGSCPDIDFIATHTNRLFGVKDNQFYATTLGEYNDWTTFAGDNLDAYATDIVEPGKFTGIAAYQQHIVCWKPDYMYELYGAYPAQYQLQYVCEVGCIDNRSTAEVNNRLYFLGKMGIYEYGGGLPRIISSNLNENFSEGIGHTDGRRYYFNGKRADGTWKIYVYDTWRECWMPDEEIQVVTFCSYNQKTYYVAADGKVYEFGSGSEQVAWEFKTKKFDDGVMGNKYVSGLKLQAELEIGTTMNIYLSVDEGDFKLIKSIEKTTFKNISATFRLQRGQRYQFKIEVKGKGKIYGFRREFVVGGDI